MKKKERKISFGVKTQMCFFVCIVLFIISFFSYAYVTLRDKCTAIMENYNRNTITSVMKSFSVIDESVKKTGVRVLNLPAVTRLIYRENESQNQHVLDIYQLSKEMQTIPYIASAVTYNNRTGQFEYYGCGKTETVEIEDTVLTGAKKKYPFTPYITTYENAGKNKSVITYYCYDYHDDNTMKGAVAFNIGMDWLESILQSGEEDGINIMLCDGDGNIVYSYNNSDVSEEYTERLAKNIGGDSFGVRCDGEKNYVTTEHLPSSDYYIVCEQKYSVIYSGYMNQIRINLIVLILIVAVLGFGAARALANYVSKPVNKMSAYVTNNQKAKLTDDVFEEIYSILKQNPDNTFRLGEMKQVIHGYHEQNNLILLLNNEKSISEEECLPIKEFFGDRKVVGAELLFEHSMGADNVRYLCRTYLDEMFEYKIAAIEYNDYILVIRDCGDSEKTADAVIRLKERIEKDFRQRVSLFISTAYDFADISRMYEELKFIRGYELIYSRGCVLDKKTIEENLSTENTGYPSREENNILKAIDGREAEKAELLFDDFLSAIVGREADDFRASILRLTINIQSRFENTDRKSYEEIADIIKQIPKFTALNEVCDSFVRMVDICCRGGSEKDDTYSSEVRRMLRYIEKHFDDPLLNPDMLADELELSASYCNKRFREEVGTSISKYTTEYRLKKAVQYLNDTNESINSIITKVGFFNESNFYRQFKKYYGVTPREYKAIGRKTV